MRNNIYSSLLNFYYLFCFLNLFILFSKFSIAANTFNLTQSIKEGETLVSAEEIFELGFFSPGNSKNRYLGIWYKKIPVQTYVWVANRNNPLSDSSGVLKFDDRGNLILLNKNSSITWFLNVSNTGSLKNPIARLLDSGNLVIREETEDDDEDDTENYLWQSFDYPTDTLLPGMKLGRNLKTGFDRVLTSWKNADDPSTGDYVFKIDHHGFPQPYVLNKQIRHYRSGPWNGLQFSGVPEMKTSRIIAYNFVYNQEEIYYSYVLRNKFLASRLVLSLSGSLQRFNWQLNISSSWNLYWYAPKDQCDTFMECGVYGICDINEPALCKCVKGFEPKYPQNLNLRDGSGGCVKKMEFECQNGDGFLKMKNMKLPESSRSFLDIEMSLKDCEYECWKNCSCKAYANSNISNGGSGCVMWVDDLIDLRQYKADGQEGGQDLHVRVAASELEEVGSGTNSTNTDSSAKKKRVTLIIIVTVIPGILLLALLSYFFFIWKERTIMKSSSRINGRAASKDKSQDVPLFDIVMPGTNENLGENKGDLELPIFDLGTLATATYNFSDANKLGQGGFGSVYKGTLSDGQQIAVKRLSKSSVQGVEEFKNEVKLIARLQHRNLVRLLGCCIEGEEKMLIYEYMQNRSLDSVLFNKAKGSMLDWQKRFDIICGIARGLLYLHQDSRFRIIHRDLKGSNILLDDEMNPKISDFGIARIFGRDQTEANTKRIVGTYGYMSPEYAMDGLFSEKSDVFSFGVLVLEIVIGRKNRGFYDSNTENNLLGYAWSLWKEGRGLELMDASLILGESCPTYQVLRCIQIGLLCVQERDQDRPTMSSVVMMLTSDENATLPAQPKQPGFCLLVSSNTTDQTQSSSGNVTVNRVTVTMLEGR